MASVEIAGLTRRYGSTVAVDGVSLSVRDGAFVALLGPSGCGKTTLLRLVAGFEHPEAGEIHFGGQTVSRPGWAVPPERRGIGMVFQSYALWPHMTVDGNVGFALKVRGMPRRMREAKVARALEIVGLTDYESRRPAALSGGQRQRVALARCLAMEPRLILLDEPLANLDAHLRETMLGEFRRFHREIGTTFFYVTHDQSEAMALADEIAVMDAGRIRQVADPRTLYREPATPMVARFIGKGMVCRARVVAACEAGSMIDLLGAKIAARGSAGAGREVDVCLRPADLSLRGDGAAGIIGTIADIRYQGARTVVTVKVTEGVELRVDHTGDLPAQGDRVSVAVHDAWIIGSAAL